MIAAMSARSAGPLKRAQHIPNSREGNLMATRNTHTPGISDAAVLAKTGKVWKEWFSILDAADAREMSHKEIVAFLSQRYKVGPWWEQMVTVAYEQSRGLRKKHVRPEGFEISASKTITGPVSLLYKAWIDRELRRRWLPGKEFTIRTSTPNRSLRMMWHDGTTNVSVGFYPKERKKCQLTVQHGKLPNARSAAHAKAYWSKALEVLKSVVESRNRSL